MASPEDNVESMAHAVDVSNAEAPAGFRLLHVHAFQLRSAPCKAVLRSAGAAGVALSPAVVTASVAAVQESAAMSPAAQQEEQAALSSAGLTRASLKQAKWGRDRGLPAVWVQPSCPWQE